MFFNRNKENRKWQTRPVLYKGRFYYFKQAMLVFLGSGIVISVLVLFLYLRNSDALSIKRVEVLGEFSHLTRDQVIALAEIKPTNKLFVLNLFEVQKKIKRFSWIDEVSVRREFPDTIQIHITERKPVALLLLDEMYLMDERGHVFVRAERDDLKGLPVITGFQKRELQDFPHLMRVYLNECLAFLSFVETQAFYQDEKISEIHFDVVAGMTVYTKKSGLEVYYGKNQYKQKHETLEKFKLSKFYKEKPFVRLDLDNFSKVVARGLQAVNTNNK